MVRRRYLGIYGLTLLGVVVVAGSLSCAGRQTNGPVSKPADSPPKNQVSFDEFLARFSRDTVFQLQSIQFPLKCQSPGDDESGDSAGEDSTVTTYIPKDSWQCVNFLEMTGFGSPVELSWRITKDEEVTQRIRGIDTGVSVEYVFRRQGSSWLLVELKDNSN